MELACCIHPEVVRVACFHGSGVYFCSNVFFNKMFIDSSGSVTANAIKKH